MQWLLWQGSLTPRALWRFPAFHHPCNLYVNHWEDLEVDMRLTKSSDFNSITLLLADALSFLSMSICSWILLLFSSLSSLTFWTRVCPFFWSSNTPLALHSWFKSPWRSYRSKGYSNRHSSLLNCYNIIPLHTIEAVLGLPMIRQEIQHPYVQWKDQMNCLYVHGAHTHTKKLKYPWCWNLLCNCSFSSRAALSWVAKAFSLSLWTELNLSTNATQLHKYCAQGSNRETAVY